MSSTAATDIRAPMDRASFYAMVEDSSDRWERVDWEPIPISSERRRHALLKFQLGKLLDRAITAGGLPLEALIDGMSVQIGEASDYVPDVAVHTDPTLDLDALAMPDPVIVAEITSRSTRSIDTGVKLAGYFTVPSIAHYLIVLGERRAIIHHRRDGTAIATTIITSGAVRCEPPGLSFTVEELYAALPGV